MDEFETMLVLVDGQDREYEIYLNIDEPMWKAYVNWILKQNPKADMWTWEELSAMKNQDPNQLENIIMDSAGDLEAFLLDTRYEELLEGELEHG